MRRTFTIITFLALLAATVAAASARPVGAAGTGSGNDQAIADAGTIVDTDLTTTGWQTSPDDDSIAEARAIARRTKGCQRYVAWTKSLETATKADSAEYDSDVERISNHAYVFATEAAARKAFGHVAAKGTDTCLSGLLVKEFRQALQRNRRLAAALKDYRVAFATVPELATRAGDESVGYAGGLDLFGEGGNSTRILLTTLVARVGRVVLTYQHQLDAAYAVSSPNVNDTFDAVVDATVARTQAAQA